MPRRRRNPARTSSANRAQLPRIPHRTSAPAERSDRSCRPRSRRRARSHCRCRTLVTTMDPADQGHPPDAVRRGHSAAAGDQRTHRMTGNVDRVETEIVERGQEPLDEGGKTGPTTRSTHSHRDPAGRSRSPDWSPRARRSAPPRPRVEVRHRGPAPPAHRLRPRRTPRRGACYTAAGLSRSWPRSFRS